MHTKINMSVSVLWFFKASERSNKNHFVADSCLLLNPTFHRLFYGLSFLFVHHNINARHNTIETRLQFFLRLLKTTLESFESGEMK